MPLIKNKIFFLYQKMMTYAEIQNQFNHCKSWEERYRLLIKLSRELPKLDENTLSTLPEISGCESRLWFKFQATPRTLLAYSDARLMQGLLVIISAWVNEKNDAELKAIDLQAVFSELNITKNLTNTRLNGIHQINHIIKQHC